MVDLLMTTAVMLIVKSVVEGMMIIVGVFGNGKEQYRRETLFRMVKGER